MPFTITPIRRNIPTPELLADLRRVAKKLNTHHLSGPRYSQHGRFAAITLIQRFGSWTRALAQVNLRPAHIFNTSPDMIRKDLQRVAKKLHTPKLSIALYRAHGQYSPEVARRHFKSWPTALQAAGLQPMRHPSPSHQDLLDNLHSLWQKLNRQPRALDLRPPLSHYCERTYAARFGSWNAALIAFHNAMNPNAPQTPLPTPRPKNKIPSTHINWRLRYKVLQRAHFRCQSCGRSPATHPEITLQVDHIHPRSQGGPSTLNNLQSLCQHCNYGKGDLRSA